MRGKSQHVRISSGVDSWSIDIRWLEKWVVSVWLKNQERLRREIIRLWEVRDGQSHFLLINHVDGISISVGIKIFSIVGG